MKIPSPTGRRFVWMKGGDSKAPLEVLWVDDHENCDNFCDPVKRLFHRRAFQPTDERGLPLTSRGEDGSAKEVGLVSVAARCPRSLTEEQRSRIEVYAGTGSFERSRDRELARRASERTRGGEYDREDEPKRAAQFEKLYP
jgi:hypothetical protein